MCCRLHKNRIYISCTGKSLKGYPMKKKKKSKEGLILVSTYTKPLVPTYLFDGIEIKITRK